MAALSDADLRLILGENYEEELKASQQESEERRKKRQTEDRLKAFETSRLSAFFLASGGLIFAWAGWMLSGFALSPQIVIGLVGFAIGLVWFAYILTEKKKLEQSMAVPAAA